MKVCTSCRGMQMRVCMRMCMYGCMCLCLCLCLCLCVCCIRDAAPPLCLAEHVVHGLQLNHSLVHLGHELLPKLCVGVGGWVGGCVKS